MRNTPGRKNAVAPRSTLAIAGKQRPPKVEKLRGDEVPPPETAVRRGTKEE
ncbi:MAG TPA: hypothetical protein VNB29_10275 [Chthoniobacterales bacterium]|nr:hypothetical protein [Chthoniobacterales bacterium]